MALNILIITYGSLGDVAPYVALARGFIKKGHAATICTGETFKVLIESNGVQYRYMNDQMTGLINSATGRRSLENLSNIWGFLKVAFNVARRIGPIQQDIVRDSWEAAKSSQFDTIIYSPKAYFACHFTEKLDIPSIAAPLFPQHIPTNEFPALGFPPMQFMGTRYNLLTYQLVELLGGLFGGKHIKDWRAQNDMKPAYTGLDLSSKKSKRTLAVLNAYSGELCPQPTDYASSVITTGFWFLDQKNSWTPPASLVKFLEHENPPVYIGFGSMALAEASELTSIIVDVLGQLNIRAVLATGWGGLQCTDQSSNIYTVESLPHDWIFPKVRAIVHHGGAGTLAAGLRAGKPTLICPIFGDQPFWGKLVHRMKLGPPPLKQTKIQRKNFGIALSDLIENRAYKINAEKISRLILAEGGVEYAVDLVEELVGAGSRNSGPASTQLEVAND
ncbi:glycosyltransferase [Gilvimarinus sp. SDUM040013]|uniref:Glycosyltransferase n=1 Tax=Gilvimarinus gilvus TaxID=3058038 RepID=A0ABU4S2W3_9GAMM|nr:glycosyltransferase [Gilvimarinus sp. SDUM040013]MDO3385653.1 glycosyltransferase [Gilvimarinus sp. SDUM040013]MDX6851519.1 glycosyltransferase [Gilvimarinus sp. SDUM040013]